MTAPTAATQNRIRGAVTGVCRDPAALSPEWQQLARERESPPFLWPGWIERWSTAFGSGDPELITARDGDGRLTGVLPLLRRGRVLTAPANEHTPLFAPLAGDHRTAELLFGEALDRCRGALDVAEIPPGGCAALRAAAASRGLHCRIRTTRRAPVIDLTSGWESYRSRISRNTWRTIRRTRRDLRKLGPIEVEWHDGGERLPELLAEGFALEASGWKGERGTAIVSRAATVRFYSAIATWGAAHGMLWLGFLRAGDRRVAFKLGLTAGGAFHPLKVGIDRSAGGSPGALHTYESILRACAEGLERIDLGGRDQPHKLHWNTGVTEISRARVFARTAAGRAARLRGTVLGPAAKRVKERAR